MKTIILITSPAYYNSSVRDVLDCSDGDSVGDLLVENNNPCDDSIQYRKSSNVYQNRCREWWHWMGLMNKGNHPAYYNTSIRDVLDCMDSVDIDRKQP